MTGNLFDYSKVEAQEFKDKFFMKNMQTSTLTEECYKVHDWMDNNITHWPENLKFKFEKIISILDDFVLSIYISPQDLDDVNYHLNKDRIVGLINLICLMFVNYYRKNNRFQYISHKLQGENEEFPDHLCLKITFRKKDKKLI